MKHFSKKNKGKKFFSVSSGGLFGQPEEAAGETSIHQSMVETYRQKPYQRHHPWYLYQTMHFQHTGTAIRTKIVKRSAY